MVFTVFHLYACIIHEQIVCEFNRIMGKPIATEINEIWGEMAAQIIQLAKQEVDNHWIQDILADQPEELSEGGYKHMYLHACCTNAGINASGNMFMHTCDNFAVLFYL